MKTLSVVIPVYYNAESLPELFERLQMLEEELAKRDTGLELIFVDDGSKDNSFEVMQDLKKQRPETKLIKLTKNFGAVACSGTGLHYATGDCVALLAADLQDPPEQLLPMLDAWEKGHKFVLSRRRFREDPLLTRIYAALYYKILEFFVVKGYPKGGADIIVIDKSLLAQLLPLRGKINRLLYLFWLGFEPEVLEYDRPARKYGKSRWTFKKKFFYFLDTITGFSVTPLRLISALGIGISAVSMLYGIRLVFAALANGVAVPGFTTLVVLISVLSGLIIAMLSIIGEYLWRIFRIVNHYPKAVIEQEYI